jgi:glycosyltransferase involved in cell wall biosynthesis
MGTLIRNYKRMSYSPNSERIPVLHIIKSLGRGGAEILLPETLHKHDQDKYQFHYIYFLPWKNQVVEQIKKEGGIVTCLAAKNNLEIMMKVRKVARYIKKHNIQLVHCHLPWAGVVGRIAGRLTGVPVVYTEHNKWERYHKATYYLNKLTFSSQQRVVAVSGEVANSIQKHYRKKNPEVQVVLNGIDTDKYAASLPVERDIRKELSIAADTKVVGIACVFRAQKRLTAWLEVAAELHIKNPDTYFIIVGDGPLKNEVHQKAQELGTEKYVHFAGLQTEMRSYLKAMDVFMMSSEFEGLPIALLEAMSMGCIPACTAAGGIPELVKDNANGILVPVAEPLKLVDRLSECLQQPDLMLRLKLDARKTVVDSFNMQKMVDELETIYSSLVSK